MERTTERLRVGPQRHWTMPIGPGARADQMDAFRRYFGDSDLPTHEALERYQRDPAYIDQSGRPERTDLGYYADNEGRLFRETYRGG